MVKVKYMRKKIVKNYIFNLLYKTISILVPLVLAPYLSKTIGAEGIGTYAYYFAIAHYFYLFGKMGLNNYGAREIAMASEKEKNYIFSAIFYQQLFASAIVFFVYLLFCIISLDGNNYIPLIFGLYVIGCLFDIDWLYTGSEKFDVIAKKNIIVKAISVILVFIYVKNSNDLWKYVLIMSIGMLFGYITLWIGIRKEITFVKVKFNDIIKHFKPNIILLFPVLSANIYRSVDKIMVGKMYSMSELGYYENAEKVIYAINSFITAFTTLMMPRCSILLAKNNFKKCFEKILNTVVFLFFIIILMGSTCSAISENIVLVVFGKDFSRSIYIMQLLTLTLPFMLWSEIIRSMWIIPNKKDNVFLTALGIGATLNFILNLLTIPKYGAIGACIATIIAECSVPIIQFIFLKNELNYKLLLKNALIFIFTGISNVIFLSFIKKYFEVNLVNLLLLLFIGTLSYIVITCLFILIFFKKTFVMYLQKLKRKESKYENE